MNNQGRGDKKNSISLNQLASQPLNRRSFMKMGVGTAISCTGLAWALSPLKDQKEKITLDEFLQNHYERLTPEMMDRITRRLESKILNEYGVQATVKDVKPMDGVEFAYALNIGRCVGCRRCVYACMKENNNSRDPAIQYIRVLEMEKGSLDLEKSNHHYNPAQVPNKEKYYIPVQCHQ